MCVCVCVCVCECVYCHLSLSRNRVPVSSSERELPAADSSQNLLRCVLRTVSEGSEAAEEEEQEEMGWGSDFYLDSGFRLF